MAFLLRPVRITEPLMLASRGLPAETGPANQTLQIAGEPSTIGGFFDELDAGPFSSN
ncbi:MAG: hypothetical protein U0894_03370 [Pirellulales bacterium]